MRPRTLLFQAIIAFLAAAGNAQAETIYSVYDGGAGGNLDFQFASQVPISPSLFSMGEPRSFLDAPFFGTRQSFTGIPMGFNISAYADTIHMGTSDNLFLQFAVGSIPTLPGTYDLVPGAPLDGNYDSSRLIGSYAYRGINFTFEIANALQLGMLRFVDTVVITDPPDAPEPASILLVLSALVMAMPLYCRC